jgi:hypothetical protein
MMTRAVMWMMHYVHLTLNSNVWVKKSTKDTFRSTHAVRLREAPHGVLTQ